MTRAFAFVVHPLAPWQRRLLGIRHRDRRLLRGGATEHPRRIATLEIDTIAGPVTGHIIGTSLLPEELLADQTRARDQQEQAVGLARDLGASVVGLGSALAVVAGRGEHAEARWSIPVTTGHAATAWACAELALQASGDEPIGILGMRSTVGDAIAGLLAERRQVLVAARGKADERRAQRLGVHAVSQQELLDRCRVVVGASTTGPCLSPTELSAGTVLIDLANPPSLEAGALATGVVVLAGETLAWPGAVRGGFWGALWRTFAGYEGGLAYACLVEPLAAAATGEGPWSQGRRLDLEGVRRCGAVLTELGFAPRLHRRRQRPKP